MEQKQTVEEAAALNQTPIQKLIEWMDLNYGHVSHSEVQAMAIQLDNEDKAGAASLPTNSMPGWIDERMDKPKSMYPVIVAAYYGKKLITASDMAYFRDGNWFDNSNDLPLVKGFVRYWMERPEPPNGQ
jgi:hypothetical protein